ncbi:putative ABC transport system ATP-binding protein [Formivibrio citricus]|uniref:Putative ABC transport system ATP-binding protein n=1 Tax=Formivibrio citricus TaxID=83765 RepID=A0A1I4Y823_9NEIS|nr:ABC transporter ATP-binding protein [Formivibrio citricus]SFN34181.1 putative ABC transport system ATP-binding protein [Formivibrio citricus]
MSATDVIRITHLGKDYDTDAGPVTVLRGISFSIHEGEFVAIMGPSGSGKSTLMNILGCLDTPTSGEYVLNGHSVSELDHDQLANLRNRVIGFVFQGFNLLQRATLTENVALPLVYRGVARHERNAKAESLLGKVGLASHVRSYPNKISGGQQQRVAIARSLVGDPRLILADEPTGNLDTHTSQEIMDFFTRLNREDGITVVVVTHEHDIAAYAQRLIRLVDGKIAYDGPAAAGLHEHAEVSS